MQLRDKKHPDIQKLQRTLSTRSNSKHNERDNAVYLCKEQETIKEFKTNLE